VSHNATRQEGDNLAGGLFATKSRGCSEYFKEREEDGVGDPQNQPNPTYRFCDEERSGEIWGLFLPKLRTTRGRKIWALRTKKGGRNFASF